MDLRGYSCLLLFIFIGSGVIAQEIDYGADAVNAMKERDDMIKGGENDYDYLSLKNHKGPSGVPLGGIGTGCFDITPEGAFSRIAINNTHEAGVLKNVTGSFFAIWDGQDARILQRTTSAGLKPVEGVVYTGLFPTLTCNYGNDVTLRAYSGLIAHNIKDSSLPAVWFEITIKNTTDTENDFAVAFSWEDIISRGIFEYKDPSLFRKTGNTAWGLNTIRNEYPEKGLEPMDRVATYVKKMKVGTYTGLLQYADPIKPSKATFQNYVNKVAILAEEQPGTTVFFLPGWDVNDAGAWATFKEVGRFGSQEVSHRLHHQDRTHEAASVVAVRTKLKSKQSKTIRFMLAWFAPELSIDRSQADPMTYFGSADYNRYYHNYFDDIESLVSYAADERERIYEQTRQWQKPVLDSTLPDWLKFKLINSGYVIYTNSILNKAGDFAVMEGMMGGLAGTMDQRLSSHPFFQKFFTDIDRSEMELFGYTPGSMEQILHFDGNYYIGISSRDAQSPAPEGWMLDNSGSWLVQLAKEYQQTGDIEYIEQFRSQIKGAVNFLQDRILHDIQIPSGYTTYDDFWHPEIYSYTATTYPAFLDSAIILAKTLGEEQLEKECRMQKERSIHDAVKYLWNGRFFAYGCDPNGSNRRDYIMFSGQLAGQFVSRYCQWEENFPLEMTCASLISQFKTNVGHSVDYYAPKVWNIDDNKAESSKYGKSTCWPFYLESYTAMAAIQAGFVEDGLDIMKHIQLVHLRNGWTWTQNLWQPGEVTYMTAPVTWFITDVLAGAGVDVTENTLYLAPVVLDEQDIIKLPLFYPRFWAMITLDPKKETAVLEITKTFGNKKYSIDKLICRPVGKPFSQQAVFSLDRFEIASGNTLDLSMYYDAMTDSDIKKTILRHIDEIEYRKYQPEPVLEYPHIKADSDSFIETVQVTISCAEGDVFYTLDSSDPRRHGKKYSSPLEIDKDCTILAVVKREGQYSPVQKKVLTKIELLMPDLDKAVKLQYKLFQGNFKVLPDFDSLTPVKSGDATDINVSDFEIQDHFAVVYEGAVSIPKEGVYTFRLRSDDGSKLTLGGKSLVNDGIHDPEDLKSMSLPMNKGIYSMTLEYFEYTGGQLLEVDCTNSDGERIALF